MERKKAVLIAAVFSALTAEAASPEAIELRGRVKEIVGLESQRERAPKRDTVIALDATVDALLADLLFASNNKASEGFAYRSMSAGSFSSATGCRASYRLFRACRDALIGQGYLDFVNGFNRAGEFEGGRYSLKGRRSRYRATPALLELAQRCGVVPSEVKAHYSFTKGIRDFVRVKAEKKPGKPQKILNPPVSPRMEEIYSEVVEVNTRLAESSYSFGPAPVLHRVFNCGDRKGFSFDLGGRFSTSDGENGFQQIPSEGRLRILIDGAPVSEIDIKSSHPTILFALSGSPLPERDLYLVEGLPRETVKGLVTAMIGQGRCDLRRWPQGLRGELKAELERSEVISEGQFNRRYPISTVSARIAEALPPLKLLRKGELDWARLQYIESEVIVATMLRCSRELAAPALPVHDSVIVPSAYAADAEIILREEFTRIVGIEPRTVTKP